MLPAQDQELRQPAGVRHAAGALPVFALYGEARLPLSFDALHVETLHERSAPHGWTIQPHRHLHLVQLFHITHGHGQALLDGQWKPFQAPCLLLIPACTVHGFRFTEGSAGTVITLSEPHLRAALTALPDPGALQGPGHCIALHGKRQASHRSTMAACVRQLLRAHADNSPWRAVEVDAALRLLLVGVVRAESARQERSARDLTTVAPRARDQAERYRALVELHYREQPSMRTLAAKMGITTTQLNRICQRVFHCSALAVLHGRLALEAQRELRFTASSIKQISLGLGFRDAPYFTRFFLREVGTTPSRWRATGHEADVAADLEDHFRAPAAKSRARRA